MIDINSISNLVGTTSGVLRNLISPSPASSSAVASGGKVGTAGSSFEKILADSEQKNMERMAQQQMMQEQFQRVNHESTMYKNQHDSNMTVIRNMRVSG